MIGHLVSGQLLSGGLQAAAHRGIWSHHSAGHLEQPALDLLQLIVVSFLFLHLALQILHMSLDYMNTHRKHTLSTSGLHLTYSKDFILF